MKYYLENKVLWKIENDEYFYFSRYTLDWKKVKVFFCEVVYADVFEISEKEVKEKIAKIKSKGKIDKDDLPIFYFSDDNEWIYAMDANKKEFVFNLKENALIEHKGCVMLNCMKGGWGVCSEEYAKKRMAEIANKYKKD